MTARSDELTLKQGQSMADALKSWVMVLLTLVFVGLYGAALAGWLRPLSDERMVARLEPIIFVIIGYYFGRLPAQQNERVLKDEVNRQTQRSDAAQHAGEQAQRTAEALEEKVKNVKAALTSAAPGAQVRALTENASGTGAPVRDENLRHYVAAALNILNS